MKKRGWLRPAAKRILRYSCGMEIVEFSPELLSQLTQLVNQHIHTVPPGWTLSDLQVASILSDTERFWALHYPEGEPSPTHIACVLDAGHLAAAAQWDEWTPPDDTPGKIATLIWIAADPEKPEVLDTLLNAIISKARQLHCCQIITSRFGFGVGWMSIPTHWQHLIKGMKRAGFQVFDQWVIMTASIETSLSEPSRKAPQATLKWSIRENSLEWDLEAYVDEARAGECQAWGIPTYFGGCQGFEEWVTVEWLGVEEPHQCQGIGRLLMQEQMRFHARRGVKNVIVWTETDNWEARKFNEALGFESGPECWTFSKQLEGDYG